MTAKRLTPAIKRALEPYLPTLLRIWRKKARMVCRDNCPICRAANNYCRRCPVFGRTLAARQEKNPCFKYFPEARMTAAYLETRKSLAGATVERLEAVRDWLKAQKSKEPKADA